MKEPPEVHVPNPSFWPIFLAAGLALIAVGVVASWIVSIIGILVVLVAIGGWAMENRETGPHA